MTGRQVIRRGVRLGLRIGTVPAILFGCLWLVAAAARLFGGTSAGSAAGPLNGVTAVGGSLAVGVLLGAATGGALALAPEWIAARAALRGLLAGAVASTVFLGEVVVVAFATEGGYAPIMFTLLATPAVGAAAAAHSGDILGRTHYHPWLSHAH
ncbi:hypothetical protein HUT18_25370 [Streptomyces sp. NA04227]|uniref:hypothetical protein n=1 Tax=Streptomyces sp. NA04227 TaxID=2742136 RepID=UPI0015925A54|nr:hypothetical protein [Streptomyces sp. NA04227]QKW09212.1 hypothetical protein HUT18_25370 [Streptomyces sp. NA04227]